MLLRQNVHPKIVQERQGHSTIALTMDTYSHLVPDAQDEAADAIDRALDAVKAANHADGCLMAVSSPETGAAVSEAVA